MLAGFEPSTGGGAERKRKTWRDSRGKGRHKVGERETIKPTVPKRENPTGLQKRKWE